MLGPAKRKAQELQGDKPFMWLNAPVLAVDLEVGPKAARRMLPGALRPSQPARAILFVGDYQETSFEIPYREIGLLVHAKLGLKEVVHCPWILVDDDVALILGREYLGFPKKLGEISLSFEADRVRATADRKGQRLVEIHGSLGAELPDPPPMMGRSWVNVWNLLGLSVPKLLRFTLPEKIASCRNVDATVDVRGTDADPLQELQLGKVLGARLYRTSFGSADKLPMPVLPVTPGYIFRNWALRHG
jgi:acetoacetate decarboxylase